MSSSKTFSFKKNNKKAFTLIELSIVLIIIGLLIVAITSGSSLIRNAKLRSITNEAKQYQVAVNSFFMKFDKYPGDFGQDLGQGAHIGDQNDKIEWINTDGDNEGSIAWLQLTKSNILPSDITTQMFINLTAITGNSDVVLSPTSHFPTSSENSAGWIFNTDGTDNYVQLVKAFGSQFDVAHLNAPTVNNTEEGGALTPTDAYSIDNKNDDGLRNAGDIREVFDVAIATGAAGVRTESAAGDTNCISDTASENYRLTNDAANVCSLAFKVTIN
jgi:prepilin-type N-terminal cleavage/methylation domain-containing protein